MIKHIPVLGLIVAFLVTFVACSTPKEVKKILADAEQIINETPDSAYTMLKSVDEADLVESRDRALFALLWTQAQDKCFEPFVSDSTINIAVDYFKRGSDRTHYARSLFYRGRYEASQHNTNQAIVTLKQAENIATDTNDLALINFDIGKLYEDQDLFDSAIERYKISSSLFEKKQNLRNTGILYGRIGFAYQLQNNKDSALRYLIKASSVALETKDTSEIISSLLLISGVKTYFSNDYALALKEYFEILNKYKCDTIPDRFKGSLLGLYYNCQKFDEASSLALARLANNSVNTISTVLYLSKIEEKAGNYQKALKYQIQYNRLFDSLWQNRLNNYVYEFEKKYDNVKLANINDNLRTSKTIWALFSIILIFCVAAICFIYRNQILRREREISNAKIFINDLEHKVDQYNRYSGIKTQGTETIRKLLKLSYEFQGNKELFYKKFTEIMSIKDTQKEVIKIIIDTISTQRPKLFEAITTRYPTLSQDEVIFMGFMLSGVTNEEMCKLYQIEYHSVVVKWSRLRKKINISNNKEQILSGLDNTAACL